MGGNRYICAAIVVAMTPAVALADDPRDPAMRSAAAHARDREATRQLNVEAAARVRQPSWRTVRSGASYVAVDDEYAARSQDHARDMANYARNRAQYDRQMAEWRRAVNACRAGDYSACDN